MANRQQNPGAAPAANTKPKKAKKRKRTRRKHPVIFTIFLILFSLFVSALLTVVIVGSTMFSYMNSFVNGKKVIDLDFYKSSQSQTSIMYGTKANGKTVELTRLHGEENRIWVDYDEFPDDLIWAFVCLEDKRFFEHEGVDWIRTLAVMVNPNYSGQGASTITQQLIKNLTKQNEVTYIRKFNEILRALNLEKNYSKKDILEAYLNTIYLGNGCYGVKTAAEKYFGKEVKDLRLVECATLAAIVKAPYTLNPIYDYDHCMQRKDLCLDYMHESEKLTNSRWKKAKKQKVTIVNKSTSSEDNNQKAEVLSWYEEYVIDQVVSDLMAEYGYEYNEALRMIYYGGLKIYAAVDLDLQAQLEKIYVNRSGFPYSRTDKNGKLPQSAMTIMDYQGRIVALVGGTGEKTANRAYNRATDRRAKRQPGSSIKPLAVYAPAVDLGLITPTSPILEKAITVGGRAWPRNFNGDHGSGSYISVQEALVRSLNTVPVRILSEMLGTNSSMEYCNEHFHLNLSSTDKDLSPLAVGGTNTGVTTLEMAAAFACFGNGGKYYKPYSYYRVVDRNGETLLENKDNEPERALKLATANTMLGMLTKAVTQSNGTGYGSKIGSFQTFAKTGTTSDNCDKWYCGGTPHYVTAVWYGYDYRADLHTGSTNPAKTIFKYVFTQLTGSMPSKTFADVIVECGGSKEDADEVVSSKAFTAAATTAATTRSSSDDDEDDDDTTRATTRLSTTTATTSSSTTAATTQSTTAATTTAAPTTAAPTTAASAETDEAA
ncbi:MAG: transglycosylase domain-containing protein [Clostridia bacterium]|nr:transglycosylase domain-containing protein [Clostridia bacterium]